MSYEKRMAWYWYALGNWVLGIGFGSAAVTLWPVLMRLQYLPLCVGAVGCVLAHGLGRKRSDA